MSDIVMQNINHIEIGPGVWTKLCNEFHKEKYEMTMTHHNEARGADLSLAALHKERNKYKALSTVVSSPIRKEDIPNSLLNCPKSERISPHQNSQKKTKTLSTIRRQKDACKLIISLIEVKYEFLIIASVLRFLNLKSFKKLEEMKERNDSKRLLEEIQTKMRLMYKPTLAKTKTFRIGSIKGDWEPTESSQSDDEF